MDAVITAGSKPTPNEPLYEYTRGGYKAMLTISGKPMIQWILDAVSASKRIDRVVIVGLPPYINVICDRPLTILEDCGGLLANLRAGLAELRRQNPSQSHAVLLTSDVPAVTAEMIDWVVNTAQETDHDFIYPVIERSVMEKRFPGSKRTYLRLKDVEVSGGDVMAFRTSLADENNPTWSRIIDHRKNPLRQASLLGFDTLFMILLRQLTLKEAGDSIGKRIGLRARAVLCPYAEVGMDIDKPFQRNLVERALSNIS
jgi:hypothetical protein